MNMHPMYRRRRRVAVAVVVTVLAPLTGWVAGCIDNARLSDQCREDPSGIYCTEQDRNR